MNRSDDTEGSIGWIEKLAIGVLALVVVISMSLLWPFIELFFGSEVGNTLEEE